MNKLTALAVVSLLTFATGCASTGIGQTTASAGPAKWETVTLTNGVELKISDEAGPEARRVAEQIQSEMRSRYLGAR